LIVKSDIAQRTPVQQRSEKRSSLASPVIAGQRARNREEPIAALAFVDRDDAAVDLAFYNLNNKRPDIDKPTLVTSGQMYGSGKTEMGRHAVDCIREKPSLQKQLESFGCKSSEIKDYMEAITVCVDLQNFVETHKFQTLAEYLGHALHTSICQKKISNLKWTTIRPQEWTDSVVTVVNNFVAESNQSIFIHWDEVGCY
jgi:hypothetical protein